MGTRPGTPGPYRGPHRGRGLTAGARVEPRLRQVVLKRAMHRAGTLLAEELGADALVTGESLGQVSTQTLRNLAVAEEAAGVPLIRPLIGMDKEEIIARARRIGTHDASERVREHCHISTGRVETAARLRDVVTAEHRVDEAFVAGAVRDRRTVGVRSWRPGPPRPMSPPRCRKERWSSTFASRRRG